MSKIKQTKAPSFADIAVIDRRNKMRNTFLSQINQLVDWRPISNLLNKQCLKQPTTPMGAPSYPPLILFKILLLETWYGLSDREVEERRPKQRSKRKSQKRRLHFFLSWLNFY